MPNTNTTPVSSSVEIPDGYRGIYLERSGESTRRLVEQLMAAPEHPLSDEQKRQAYEFEAALFGHEVEPGMTMAVIMKGGSGEDAAAPMFFADALLRRKVDTAAVLGEHIVVPDFEKAQDVYEWIARLVQEQAVKPATLRAFAKKTKEHYENEVAAAIVSGESVDEITYEARSIVLDPASLLTRCQSLRQAREYLLSLRREYHEGGTDELEGANRANIDVYLGKINSMIAANIPMAHYLVQQGFLTGDTALTRAAEAAIPSGLRMAVDSPQRQQEVFRRLDFLRNGMGLDGHGHAAPISEKLFSENSRPMGENLESQPVFTRVETAVLKKTILEPEEMLPIFEDILRQADLLSEEFSDTWNPERSDRAADGKYQVVINPEKDSFAVDGITGAFKVAAKPRSLYDAIIVGGVHETEHINQSEADRKVGEVISIAAVKGRRVSMLREAGANTKQRHAESTLFGRKKGIALIYARALQTLEYGGSIADAAKAFYDEALRLDPEADKLELAKRASDRVMRLVRQGGISSQALVYAEEGIMAAELVDADPKLRSRATLVTSLDLVDQVRLHKYGLLPEINNETIDWGPLVLEAFAGHIDAALQSVADNE